MTYQYQQSEAEYARHRCTERWLLGGILFGVGLVAYEMLAKWWTG